MSTVATRTPTDLERKLAAVMARATDAVLFHGVETLEAKADGGTPLSREENMTRTWMLSELESRHQCQALDDALDAWAESDESDRGSYTATLKAFVASLAPAQKVAPTVTASDLDRAAQMAERAGRVARVRMLAARYPGRVHLIGSGSAVGIPSGDVKAGDVLAYNYGGTAVVVRVEVKGAGSVVIVTGEGEYDRRTARRTTLIPISDRPDENL